mgnify:FL=1
MNTYFYLIATFPDYYLIITRYIEKNAETCYYLCIKNAETRKILK